jgi:predicted nucleotidyltransferase
MDLDIQSPKIIAKLQQALPVLLAVYVFGSYAKGEATQDSDLDLAVLVEGKVDPLVLWELAGELATTLNCDVDLLDFRAASTVMQYQIISTGYQLWVRGAEAELYESFVLSEKLALDEARAGLLADIEEDGRVYGR